MSNFTEYLEENSIELSDINEYVNYHVSPLEKFQILKTVFESIISDQSIPTADFYRSVVKIFDNYYSLSSEDEQTILNIAKKL